MKIKRLTLSNFMAFENLQLDWSDNINIILRENSTGKTTLLKVMYSLTKPLNDINKANLTKEMEEQFLCQNNAGGFQTGRHETWALESRTEETKEPTFQLIWTEIREFQ